MGDTPSTDGAPDPRPPIGLMPRAIHAEYRLYEVEAAIVRYRRAGKDVPQEWVDEAADLRVVPEDRPAQDELEAENATLRGLLDHDRNHLTDGRWHDECEWCQIRRREGGTGVTVEARNALVPALDDDTRREVEQQRDALLWALTAAGMTLGDWTDEMVHMAGCGCEDDDLDDECEALNEFRPALLRNDANHGPSLIAYLPDPSQLAEFAAHYFRSAHDGR